MDDAAPKAIRLADYTPPPFLVDEVHLAFDLRDGATRVGSVLHVKRAGDARDLTLDGEDLELVSVSVDGRTLAHNEYRTDAHSLTIFDLPDEAEIGIVTRIVPEANTALEGLYRSGSMYCTQCEAQGFRKITYYPDRPDVLARYTTTIEADATRYPVLLSNGNLIEDSTTNGRRRVTWRDPFPKPSYLFALVAGDLAVLKDTFTTMSGRAVALEIYSEPHNIGQCDYAMGALKRAMRWDEERFGREYDLDVFMIVAVEDFNMGAMENKGLNIFNTSCVLASKDTAVDGAYRRVEAIIGHEYFHNWSGNRVTCRDWFQLSLKEGFTVFRDSEFTSDMHSRTVKRIEDVSDLRAIQFAEDAGPLAHPVRPDSYIEISNFYTTTVYEKGAEVVGMLQTMLGRDGFRRGSDKYFLEHDGKAATTDDFVEAMERANGVDLAQFRRWYEQAGTPVIAVREAWSQGALELDIRQRRPDTPGQTDKPPLSIPIVLGLVDASGARLSVAHTDFICDAPVEVRDDELVLVLGADRATLRFEGLADRPQVSFLRGFSAPVRVDYPRPREALAFLVRHDADGFTRWDALQSLIVATLVEGVDGADVVALFGALIEQALAARDPDEMTLLAVMLALPTEGYLFEQVERADVDTLVTRRDALRERLATTHADAWRRLYESLPAQTYQPDAAGMARRALVNLALGYLAVATIGSEHERLLLGHLDNADNLTDRMAALAGIANSPVLDPELRARALADFHARWRHEALVVNQWFAVQASSRRADAALVRELAAHPDYDQRNPNKVRSVFATFAQANLRNFHAPDGGGYALVADRVLELNATNPQLAARLVLPLTRWRRIDGARSGMMRRQLQRLAAAPNLSPDVFEVVTKSID